MPSYSSSISDEQNGSSEMKKIYLGHCADGATEPDMLTSAFGRKQPSATDSDFRAKHPPVGAL